MSVIKVENLSKQYRLGQVGSGSLSHDINRLWHRSRGKEDPYLKIGEENNRESKGNSDYVWALKDINFDIQQGDRVGIIGRNGAGKSTLLKILSRTTSPTSGSVKMKGRVASLLEVGTGFHPDLSGRDNIFLNGAILGMSKRDVKSRFDEIVDFAGVERYIDTPVKRYSSGMYVRLAFAVAAHLESDILIVDEVLAVGDSEFQERCLGKMGEVSKGEGKTVLFVSHNEGALIKLCTKAILIEKGNINYHGSVYDTIKTYNTLFHSSKLSKAIYSGNLAGKLIFEDVSINGKNRQYNVLSIQDTISIEISAMASQNFCNAIFIVSIFINDIRLFTLRESVNGRKVNKGSFSFKLKLPSHFLRPGTYSIAAGAWIDGKKYWLWGTDLARFKIAETWVDNVFKEDEGVINANFIKFQDD